MLYREGNTLNFKSTCKIFWRSVDPRPIFLIVKMVDIQHLWFLNFGRFVKNSNWLLILCLYAKFRRHRMIGCQVMASYRFSVWRLSAIFDWWKLVFFSVKIGGFAGKLWCIFDFQTAVRPPSWIWCDVITDHARCLFNGPNMLKKFDVDWLYSISSFLYSAILASKWLVQAPKSFL